MTPECAEDIGNDIGEELEVILEVDSIFSVLRVVKAKIRTIGVCIAYDQNESCHSENEAAIVFILDSESADIFI